MGTVFSLSLSLPGQRVAFPISNSMEEASRMMYDSEKNRRELITIIHKRRAGTFYLHPDADSNGQGNEEVFPIDVSPENIVTHEINAFLMLSGEEDPWRKHSWILHRLVIKLNRHFLASMRLLSPSCRKSIVKLRHLPFSSHRRRFMLPPLVTPRVTRVEVDACIIFHINSSIGKINKIARRRQLQIMVIEEY